MKMNKPILFLNTIRHLKLNQIYSRFSRMLFKPSVTDIRSSHLPHRSKKWVHMNLYNEKINDELIASFLNHTKKIKLPLDWNNHSLSKLWLYNLHYFEDLISDKSEHKRDIHKFLINSWINDNPIGHGEGWEPYPTSLRIVNILKAWLGGLDLDENIFNSIFNQTSFLSNDLEKHLLANHYFANLKAILFSGLIFKKDDWIELAEKSFLTEIPEQILQDGAHCELSPMYHSLILVDMLDILNLLRAYPSKTSHDFENLLHLNISKMINFMDSMAHPDGSVSFFNDSVNGIAPSKEKIELYAKKLGYEIHNLDTNKIKVIDNFDSGYICAYAPGSKLIFDASPIGYKYNPGHAHADTLSFELSIGSQRVFVNSGISEYNFSQRRHLERKTCSHNTVEIDNKDSSEVWGAFRVARRAKIVSRSIHQDDTNIEISAMHDGYKKFIGGCSVKRDIKYSNRHLKINDSIEGNYKKAITRIHIHPDIKISKKNNVLILESSNFSMSCNLNNKSYSLSEGKYSPEFGIVLSNKVLEIEILSGHEEIHFDWILK